MSYGLKYTLTFRDELGTAGTGILYQINIYKNGYGGSSANVKASDNPITLSYKKQDLISPLMGSELTISLQSTTNGQYIEFATAAPLDYYVDVLINTGSGYTTYWSGVNTTDCYTEPWQNAPYSINLKFNCGLGELQWHRYENPTSLISGLEQVIAIIANSLSFLPYVKNVREIINIREDNMSDASGLLEQLYLLDIGFTEVPNDGILHGISCNKLLNQILTSLNCRMYQSNNMWYVERIYERTKTSLTYYDYTPTGIIQNPPYTYSHIGTGSFDPRKDISNSTYPKLINGGDLGTTQKKPSLSYQFMGGNIANVELLSNSYFENNPTAKNNAGQPLNWDLQSSLAAYPQKIIQTDKFTTDPKRMYGMEFDPTCVAVFNSYINSQSPLPWVSLMAAPNTYATNWYAHSVRRTGDTYSNDCMYIDVANGSLDVDLEYWFDFRLTPTSPVNIKTSGNPGGDAYQIINNANLFCTYISLLIMLTDKNGDTYSLWGDLRNVSTNVNWKKNNPYMGFVWATFWDLNRAFPSPQYSGQAVPLTAYQLAPLLQAQYPGGFVDIQFTMPVKFNIAFPPSLFTAGNGIYKFDVRIYPPPIWGTSGYNYGVIGQSLTQTTMTLNNFAANVIDFQYKDSFQSTSSYTTFYSAADNSSRWNEQKVSVTYGDTITPGYPGSYRLSTAVPTSTWHNKGLGDTGQVLADVLFQNYSGLIADYRKSLTGKIINSGGIPFYQNIQDEDGTIYAQTGSTFDFKKASLTINMEEVSKAPPTITKGNSSKATIPLVSSVPPQITAVTMAPPLLTSNTPFGKPVSLNPSNILTYPSA